MTKSAKPVVIITGVSSGIGLATAGLFVAKGWIVVGTVRGRARGSSALRSTQVDVQVADMLKVRDLERVVQTAWRTYGRVDAVVCNAGHGLVGPLDSYHYAQMHEIIAVNFLAVAELARQVIPVMRRQGGGVIIGLSSVVGRTGFSGFSMYSASKFAVEGLFESLRLELAATPVRVKLVEPSSVNTPFWTGLPRGAARSWKDKELPAVPGHNFHRGLSADVVAAAIYRAATDKSAKLRYPIGRTWLIGVARRLMPDSWYFRILHGWAARN